MRIANERMRRTVIAKALGLETAQSVAATSILPAFECADFITIDHAALAERGIVCIGNPSMEFVRGRTFWKM